MGLWYAWRSSREGAKRAGTYRPGWKAGLGAGCIMMVATSLQQVAMLYTTAGKTAFITALYIVMTPLLAFLILRRRVTINVIVRVAIAVVGFYLLCITDGFGSITLADVVLLSTAVLFAGHILVIDTFGQKMDPILLSFGQISTTSCTPASARPAWHTRCRWSDSSWCRRRARP